jgi:antitoxin ParD1/3/4
MLERSLQSGLYDDASDVMRAALCALEREEAVLDEVLREKVKASMADKRPSLPAADVFKRLRARHGPGVRAAGRGA